MNMAENQNQVIAPVIIAYQMDGVDVEAGGIYFERLPQLTIQKKILQHLDLDTKKEFRLVTKYSRSLTDNFVKFFFSWERHLREAPNEMVANAANFKNVLSPLWKFWENDLIGVMMEFNYKYPESEETLVWVGKIINVKGYFVQLRYLSPQEELGMEENSMDFWVNLLKTDCAHSIGYNLNQDQPLRLVPPPEILDSLQHYWFVEVVEVVQGHRFLVPIRPTNLFIRLI